MQHEDQLTVSEKIKATSDLIVDKPSEEVRNQLISYINELINVDFNSLVQLLYRIDVNEKKLKQLLQNSPSVDAAPLIADLIISRQLQKIQTKKNFTSKEKTGDDDSW
ncbi:MAG: hypothetical protein M3139_05925 [Bacteroidota bacterium]|nr:hypothetical protein [Bacteroidota bacterium]